MGETAEVKGALLALSKIEGVRVWRQNVAKLPDLTGRWVQFGIPGMADISGIGPGGVRLEIEMKSGKGHRDKRVIARQEAWQRMIVKHGGIYVRAFSVEEAETRLLEAIEERRGQASEQSNDSGRTEEMDRTPTR